MLILHTADLHLGKTLHERDLLEDQAAALDAMIAAIARRRPAALLVAGDVYDRSIPPPEAIRLFDSFLRRAVEAAPGLAVVVIPGNHDSAARLSFGASLLERANVHFRTSARDCARPVVVEAGDERAAIWPVPFLGPGAFDRGVGADEPAAGEGPPGPGAGPAPGAARPGELPFDEPSPGGVPAASAPPLPGSAAPPDCRAAEAGPASQAELFALAMATIGRRLDHDSRNVLLAHCFAAGGATSESERAFVGLAEQVDASLLSAFDYAALGHLHRAQAAGARGRYPGSPIAYSFAEGADDKGFLLVELGGGGAEAEFVRITPRRAMRRIEGPFSVLAAPGALPERREDYVEARITDAEPVLNPADPLRANFPYLLSVRQAAFELAAPGAGGAAEAPATAPEGPASVAADFAAFHAEMRGSPPDGETAALFGALLAEAEAGYREEPRP